MQVTASTNSGIQVGEIMISVNGQSIGGANDAQDKPWLAYYEKTLHTIKVWLKIHAHTNIGLTRDLTYLQTN